MKTRSNAAWASSAAAAPWKRSMMPRASARLASRGGVPAGGAGMASSSSHVAIASSGRRIVLPNISSGASVMPIWLPLVFDILSTPSIPGRIGSVSTHCSGWP